MRKFRTALVLTTIACLILCTAGFDSCKKSEKDQAIAFARDLNGALRAAAPLIAQRKPELGLRMTQAINASDKLINAIAGSDKTTTIELVNEILPVFTQVASEFTNDPNVLLALALGQIALNFFVNHYIDTTGATDNPTIEKFKALPQFGCQLRPERCR